MRLIMTYHSVSPTLYDHSLQRSSRYMKSVQNLAIASLIRHSKSNKRSTNKTLLTKASSLSPSQSFYYSHNNQTNRYVQLRRRHGRLRRQLRCNEQRRWLPKPRLFCPTTVPTILRCRLSSACSVHLLNSSTCFSSTLTSQASTSMDC